VTSNPPDLPPLPTLGGPLPPLPTLDGPGPEGLPPLPTLGPVSRRPPVGGARRHWQQAQVVEIRDETANARTFRLALPPGPGLHVPGQHYDVRLTAPDGSQAQRSYSIASAPERPGSSDPSGPAERPVHIELTVERIADGDVSPYLHDVIKVGDEFEVRGPFGGWFIWRGDTPVLLVGGGSGVVPLMAMRRYWARIGRPVPLRLVVSVRSPEDLYYADEYGDESTVVYSRRAPADALRPAGRLAEDVLQPLIAELPAGTVAYVCGSAGFAEHASQLLVSLGVDRTAVRVERFGPS
jgi:ferredoxin-NADP reductase